jgi:hypothetical protein
MRAAIYARVSLATHTGDGSFNNCKPDTRALFAAMKALEHFTDFLLVFRRDAGCIAAYKYSHISLMLRSSNPDLQHV